ncbi:Xaa-Pro peptidase family protein [Opitutus sp. ER46]|uniref:M24 family metallopeptidase n=1 Tax=Opitutus sp. ER46 TaxID=2161864 RepID=UPI000D320BAC|nr:Xaa-Pro peptidase family protein [Opitutus sp. ER46]PTX96449.1 peptidase M24 [Opitutus sp. ER46]
MARPLPPPLLYADSEHNADALYFGRIKVPDAFIAFGCRGRKYAVVSALEFGRVKRTSAFDVVLPLEEGMQSAREKWPQRAVGPAEVIAVTARKLKQTSFTIAEDFPAALYARLTALGLKLTFARGMLFPEREIKSAAEAAQIREGNRCSALGFAAVERILRGSRIKGRQLVYRGRPVTSESLKFAVEAACLEAGAISTGTIVAGGDQACDPHETGSGPIRPHELVIVDIFPRLVATGYHGDMTRTYLKGRASDAQRALVAAVRDAQLAALGLIKTGVNGRSVHAKVVELFAARGYETRRTPQRSIGFFHGTGHGLGLAVHEPPRLSSVVDSPLLRGAVVTVEPGLYYPGLGGCRIEDVVQVTDRAPRLLSSHPYDWEIR